MEDIHRLINYSYSPMDLAGYLGSFRAGRKAELVSRCGFPDLPVFPDSLRECAALICQRLFPQRLLDPMSPGFTTSILLIDSLHDIAEQGDVRDELKGVIDVLQRKFELFHRLFDRYDERMRKIGSAYQEAGSYALLSLVLNLRFRACRNYNYLNTSIKLNDLLLKSAWLLRDEEKPVLAFSVGLEQNFVDRFDEF